jgi:hypothetical protein
MPSFVRRLLIALAFLAAGAGLAASAPVRYIRYKLHELAACADVVVAGEIAALQEETFDLTIEDTLVGGPLQGEIRVKRFEDWTCAGRWTPYAKGQRVLLFLRRPTGGDGTYRILGAGGEGEMPLLDQAVLVRGYRVHGYEEAVDPIPGATCSGPLVPLEELAAALTAFRRAFTWGKGDRAPIEWLDLKSEEEAKALRGSSPTGFHLWEEVVSSDAWRHPEAGAPFPANARRVEALANGLKGESRLAPGRTPGRFGFELHTDFGASCAYLGDVDGNGALDLAVGAPGDSYLRQNQGALWILFMDPRGGLLRAVEISEATGGVPMLGVFGAFGAGVAALGDLDGDGVPDLAVEAHGGGQSGGLWVLLLERTGGVSRCVELARQEALAAAGIGQDFSIGSPIANVGDLDGDGSPELVASLEARSKDDLFSTWKEGRSFLIVSLDRDGKARWARRFHERDAGLAPGDCFITGGLAGPGDLDGDRVPDLAIGVPYDDDGGEARGAVWIVSLRPDGGIGHSRKISDWEGGFDGMLRDKASFGALLTCPGDLDGDAVPDLLVGGSSEIWALCLNRDGTVKRHSAWTAGPPEDGPEFSSLAAWRELGPERTEVRLAVGGNVDLEDYEYDDVLWLLRLGSDGALESQ